MAASAGRQAPLSAARRAHCGSRRPNSFESKDGKKTYLRILEFDVDKAAFTGKGWKYPLELPGKRPSVTSNLIDATSGLIIERDDSEGDPAQACAEGGPKPDCFNVPAQIQAHLQDRLCAGRRRRLREEGRLHRPDGYRTIRRSSPARAAKDGKLTFPFFTIENVDVVDADHIIVGNDNKPALLVGPHASASPTTTS